MKYLLMSLLVLTTVSCASFSITRSGEMLQTSFKVKDASEVCLYTSYDGYTKKILTNDKDRWDTQIPYSGAFRYFLTVDGQTYLPECKKRENDDFGGQLCIYEEETR